MTKKTRQRIDGTLGVPFAANATAAAAAARAAEAEASSPVEVLTGGEDSPDGGIA